MPWHKLSMSSVAMFVWNSSMGQDDVLLRGVYKVAGARCGGSAYWVRSGGVTMHLYRWGGTWRIGQQIGPGACVRWQVVLASPYNHIGGMTTGGLQHADPANEDTVGGITREFFDRVMARYPHHPHPGPSPGPEPTFSCRAGRCLELSDGSGTSDKRFAR